MLKKATNCKEHFVVTKNDIKESHVERKQGGLANPISGIEHQKQYENCNLLALSLACALVDPGIYHFTIIMREYIKLYY
jgi:hypothetical protein